MVTATIVQKWFQAPRLHNGELILGSGNDKIKCEVMYSWGIVRCYLHCRLPEGWEHLYGWEGNNKKGDSLKHKLTNKPTQLLSRVWTLSLAQISTSFWQHYYKQESLVFLLASISISTSSIMPGTGGQCLASPSAGDSDLGLACFLGWVWTCGSGSSSSNARGCSPNLWVQHK